MATKTSITYNIKDAANVSSHSMDKIEYWQDGTEIASNYWLNINKSTSGGTMTASTNSTTKSRFAKISPKVEYVIGSSTGSCEFEEVTIKQAKHHDLYEEGEVWIAKNATDAHSKSCQITEFGGTCYIYAYAINPDVPNVHVTNIELFSINKNNIVNNNGMTLTIDDTPHVSSEYVRWKCTVGENGDLINKSVQIPVTFDYGKFGTWTDIVTINQDLHIQIIGETHFSVSPLTISHNGGTATIEAWTTVDNEVLRLDFPDIIYESDSYIKSGVAITDSGDTTYTATFDAIDMATNDGSVLKKVHFETNKGYGEQFTGEHEKVDTNTVSQLTASVNYYFQADSANVDDSGKFYVEWSGGTATISGYTEIDGVKYKMNTPTAHWANDTVKRDILPTISNGDGYTYIATFPGLDSINDATVYGDYVKSVYFTSAIGYGCNVYGELGDATSRNIYQNSPLKPRDFILLFHENSSTILTKNNYAASGVSEVSIDVDSYIKISDTDHKNTATSASTEYDWIHLKNDAYYPDSSALKFSIDERPDDEDEETASEDRMGTITITQIIPENYYSEDPPKQIVLTIYQNDKNRIVLPAFDKLILTYELGDNNGTDLDTIAYIPRLPSIAKDGTDMSNSTKTFGWSKGSEISAITGSYIVKWGADNQGSSGFESDYFDVDQMLSDNALKTLEAEDRAAGIAYQNRKFVISFYGIWYRVVSNSTPIILAMDVYSGGTMTIDAFKAIVSGYKTSDHIATNTAHVLQRQSGQSCSGASNWQPNNNYYTHFGDLEYYYEGSGKWTFKLDDEQVYYNTYGHPEYWYDGNTQVPYSSSSKVAPIVGITTLERTVYNYLYSDSELSIMDELPASTLNGLFYYNGNEDDSYNYEISDDDSYIRTLTFVDPDDTNTDASQYVNFSEVPSITTTEDGKEVTYTAVTIYPCNSQPSGEVYPSDWANINGYNYKYKSSLANIAISWIRTEED